MIDLKKSLVLLFGLIVSMTYGQMTVTESLVNPSRTINDASIILEVRGGEPPYHYKWTNQETPQTANEAINLTEGLPYSVVITDTNGQTLKKTYIIPAKSVTEILNSKKVSVIAGIYVLACLVIIFMNFQNVGLAFQAIVDGAFSPPALKGGILGVIMVGFQRASFSNEAGVGSAAIAHSTAKTNHPPSEGFVSLLEPFIDTVVVCTLTALVIIFTGFHEVKGLEGTALTSAAFESVFPWFPYVLVVAIFLFAFSTMVSWSYYGMRAWTYLFGKSRKSEMVYKGIFLCFVVLGASVSLGAVLDFSDMMILAMSVPNIIGLYILSGEVRNDLRSYLRKLKAGELFKKPKRIKIRK